MDREIKEIIDFLNYNISLEHAAIIQYLFHAYTGAEEIEDKLEEIAREEMRHLKMFAHMVVDLGGVPAIDKRANVFLEAPSLKDLLQFDIEAEKMAIEEYEKQLKTISDKRVLKILERAIEDENSHLHIFQELYKYIESKSKSSEEEYKVDENKRMILKMLNKILNYQYERILETLYQSFITRHKNPYISQELEDRAIDKMKHFGWTAEEISEGGLKPDFSLPSIKKIDSEREIVSFIEADQKESSKMYKEVADKTEDKELRWLLERISKREIYYKDLKEFLERDDVSEKDISKVVYAMTVGSLFKKKD